MALTSVLEFPDTVDERSARLVAGGVVTISLVALLGDQHWLFFALAAGFLLRVASGPRFSPLALIVTRHITPRLPGPARPTAGAPKRFAQGIGATLAVAAVVSEFVVGATGVSVVLISMIVVAASAEAVLGFCLGCRIYAVLIRVGVVEDTACEDCADLSRRAVIA